MYFISDNLLKKDLTVIYKFHSHLEALWRISPPDLKDQVS